MQKFPINSYESGIQFLERKWCENAIESKRLKLSGFPALPHVPRQKYDCRTKEAQIQREVYEIYNSTILLLDDAIRTKRICPISVSSFQATGFGSEYNKQAVINRLGHTNSRIYTTITKSNYDKFEHRFATKSSI